MLEGIDDIAWHRLTDAYGPSGSTAGHLRALASNDPRRRERALNELYGTIWHQGSVYEATVEAVPFLVRLLGEPTVKGKAEILELVTSIARGTGYWQVHQHLTLLRDKAAEPQVQGEIRAEESRLARIAARVRDGLPVYVRLLSHDEERVRQEAVKLLAMLRDQAAEALPPLERLWRDPDAPERTRAAALIAHVGLVGDDAAAVGGVLDVALGDDFPPVCRAAASLPAVSRRGSDAGAAALACCDRLAAGEDAGLGEPLPVLGPWETAALSAIWTGSVLPTEEAMLRYIAAFEAGGDRGEQRVGWLLGLAFPDGTAPPRGEALTRVQRRVIETIAPLAFPRRNAIFGNYTDLLKHFGLPETHDAMVQYLRTPLPPGVLERAVREPAAQRPWWKLW